MENHIHKLWKYAFIIIVLIAIIGIIIIMDTKTEDKKTIQCGELSFTECIKETDGFRQDVSYIFNNTPTTKDMADIINEIGNIKK